METVLPCDDSVKEDEDGEGKPEEEGDDGEEVNLDADNFKEDEKGKKEKKEEVGDDGKEVHLRVENL